MGLYGRSGLYYFHIGGIIALCLFLVGGFGGWRRVLARLVKKRDFLLLIITICECHCHWRYNNWKQLLYSAIFNFNLIPDPRTGLANSANKTDETDSSFQNTEPNWKQPLFPRLSSWYYPASTNNCSSLIRKNQGCIDGCVPSKKERKNMV